MVVEWIKLLFICIEFITLSFPLRFVFPKNKIETLEYTKEEKRLMNRKLLVCFVVIILIIFLLLLL